MASASEPANAHIYGDLLRLPAATSLEITCATIIVQSICDFVVERPLVHIDHIMLRRTFHFQDLVKSFMSLCQYRPETSEGLIPQPMGMALVLRVLIFNGFDVNAEIENKKMNGEIPTKPSSQENCSPLEYAARWNPAMVYALLSLPAVCGLNIDTPNSVYALVYLFSFEKPTLWMVICDRISDQTLLQSGLIFKPMFGFFFTSEWGCTVTGAQCINHLLKRVHDDGSCLSMKMIQSYCEFAPSYMESSLMTIVLEQDRLLVANQLRTLVQRMTHYKAHCLHMLSSILYHVLTELNLVVLISKYICE